MNFEKSFKRLEEIINQLENKEKETSEVKTSSNIL